MFLNRKFIIFLISGCNSVGRVQASQAWSRGFEPRHPLFIFWFFFTNVIEENQRAKHRNCGCFALIYFIPVTLK